MQHTPPKNASAKRDQREAERVSLYARVSYWSDAEARVSHGQLVDLSKQGCRIVGPVPPVGSSATLSLELEDGQSPLRLSGATVCWSDGFSFGIKFPAMTAEARARLQQLVLRFATLRNKSGHYKEFRLA